MAKGYRAMAMVAALVATTTAAAQEEALPYISPAFSYELLDSGRDADNGMGMRFAFGLPLGERFVVELALAGATFDSAPDDLDLGSGGVELHYRHRLHRRVSHRVGFGFGLLRATRAGNAETNTITTLGWGADYRATPRIGIRADLRWRFESGPGASYHDFLLGFGMIVPIGGI